MKRLVLTWAALIALMSTSLAVSFLPIGTATLPAGLAIALMKAALVARIFMRLHRRPAVLSLCAAVALATWLLLDGLTWLDMLTRVPALAGP